MNEPGFDILLEAAGCLVVNKPAGLLTQAPPGIESLEQRIKRFLVSRKTDDRPVYLGVPHRLDRHVSGAMIFTTRRRVARVISQQFEARLVRKVYWAIVEGRIEPPQGTWRDFVKKVPDEARAIISTAEDSEARQAIMHFKRLAVTAERTLLEIQLETGRMHQIRLQAASRGHPVIGDAKYGSRSLFGVQYDDTRLRAIGLHARSLGFAHPKTDEPIDVAAPLPPTWDQLGPPFHQVWIQHG